MLDPQPRPDMGPSEWSALYHGVVDLAIPPQKDRFWDEEYDEPRAEDGVGNIMRWPSILKGTPTRVWHVYQERGPSQKWIVRTGKAGEQLYFDSLTQLTHYLDRLWALSEGRKESFLMLYRRHVKEQRQRLFGKLPSRKLKNRLMK